MAKKTVDPFKIAATKPSAKKGLEHVTPQDEITKVAVDEYKRIAAEMKNLEGQLSGHKSVLETYATATFAARQMKNVSGNFNIDGNSDVVQFQAQNRNAGLAADTHAAFVEEYGEEAAEVLLQPSVGSIKFNFDTLKEDGVMEMLAQAINATDAKGNRLVPVQVAERLFVGSTYGVTENVFEKARQFVETAEEYEALMKDLKITRFIKS